MVGIVECLLTHYTALFTGFSSGKLWVDDDIMQCVIKDDAGMNRYKEISISITLFGHVGCQKNV